MFDIDLRTLRDKYEQMLHLRLLQAEERIRADVLRAPPRARLVRLAQEFPGALRELDQLPLEKIVQRITAIRAAEANPEQAETWMRVQIAFHRLLRGALALKRWIAGRPLTTSLQRELERRLGAMPLEAQAWASDLTSIANPPRGRLVDVVFGRLAREFDVPEDVARDLCLGRRS